MEVDEGNAEIPQEIARKLLEEGALLILTGVPIGTEFGVDLNANKIGEKFRGVKMIPPGPHFVYTAAEGAYGDTASRVGFIHYFKKQEVVIREWHDQVEELRKRPKEKEDIDIIRIKDNIQELDKYLAPYNFQGLQKWQQHTNEITEEVILRVSPENGIIRTSAEFESCPDADRPKGNSPLMKNVVFRANQSEDELLPDLKVVPETALRFTKVPALCPRNASPAEISHCYLDSIGAIEKYFAAFSQPIEAIREVQLAFVLFFCGYSVDALAHWRKILGLLSKSETAVDVFKRFYRRYLEVLPIQLVELPEELMIPSPNNTIFKDVGSLIANCLANDLKQEANALRDHLGKSMSWFFDDLLKEDPEDLPVVVELSNI